PPSPTPAQPEAAAKPNASTPAPAATCNCDKQTDPVFNLPTGAMAKKLSRLGTNPEFGDSHGLSPEEFYQKLSRQYKANAVDRAFLDRMYRAMGYPKGFAEAKAEQFSTVTLPQGSKGNLGYGKTHGTGYYELPDSERDRMAFHIEAANGCDLHFMKTCGNHFFFCSK
ncbi:MAG TPA: hypothetical protein PK971_11700, partial [Saprospiraceae bacterium]|nr:hypothetical protein [Saprospiraceae bacterium]